MQKRFKVVAVGGTFDELHKGHRTLLIKAFEIGNHVLIGLCSDKFAAKRNKTHTTAPYTHRLEGLKAFLRENNLLKRTEIVPLGNPYGITLTKSPVEALVVSRETEPTALDINEKREQKGMALLHIVVVDMIPSENHAPISTTRIRHGEIDREGHLLKT